MHKFSVDISVDLLSHCMAQNKENKRQTENKIAQLCMKITNLNVENLFNKKINSFYDDVFFHVEN